MKTTATEIAARQEADRNDRLNRSIAEFVKRYAPDDRDEAAYFTAHLHDIVRAVYADMTTPVERALAATLNVATPFVFSPNTSKS
jgi:hypothetical protein